MVKIASVAGSWIVVVAISNCGVLEVPGNLTWVAETRGLIGGGNIDNPLQFAGINNSIVHVDVIDLEEVDENTELVGVHALVLNVVLLVGERAGEDGWLPL